MMRCLNRIILLLILLISPGLPSRAQNEAASYDSTIIDSTAEMPPSEEPAKAEEEVLPVIYNQSSPAPSDWDQIVHDKDFGYRDKREFAEINEKPYEEPGWAKFLERVILFFYSAAGRIILWSLLVLVVGYIVIRILSGGLKIFG